MGAKSLYIDKRNNIIDALRLSGDLKALQDLEKDHQEYIQYSDGWKSVNLDEFLKQFKITDIESNMTANKRKISFWDDDRQYEVVCSVGASYFRIIKKGYTDSDGNKHGDVYVGLDLKEPKIPKGVTGSDAKAERNRLTHFKMTYK